MQADDVPVQQTTTNHALQPSGQRDVNCEPRGFLSPPSPYQDTILIAQEFDHPHRLLQKKEGHFSKMVQQTGLTMAAKLRKIAEDLRRFFRGNVDGGGRVVSSFSTCGYSPPKVLLLSPSGSGDMSGGERRGLDNAGKTTIVKRFNGEAIDSISPTLGFNIKTIEHKGFMLNIWDVGGQKSLRSYWRNYFESTDGLIWVVDCADKRRLDDCRKELHELLQEEILELNLIKTHNWKIVGCSAVTGDNLVAGIDWLVSDISSRIFTLD
uniref:ADP-ribosylation factor-like protein 2 n=1 Tax=Timema tahoe TaxID=61484 RepID=A0A7R9I977_9NEOP|nr:unnamed protein product [Timema tahoe]